METHKYPRTRSPQRFFSVCVSRVIPKNYFLTIKMNQKVKAWSLLAIRILLNKNHELYRNMGIPGLMQSCDMNTLSTYRLTLFKYSYQKRIIKI